MSGLVPGVPKLVLKQRNGLGLDLVSESWLGAEGIKKQKPTFPFLAIKK